MIYFDNSATTGKKPAAVINSVKYALENLSANPGRSGHTASVRVAEEVYKARERLSAFFGSEGPETVVFTGNCTHSINCVLKGLLKKGDHCIISSLEHNAVVRPLVKTGVSFSVAQVDLKDDEKTLESIRQKLKPNTKLIFVTGGSNVLGKLLPIKEIGGLCREKGIFFGVDGAQIGGVLPVNMQKQHIDFLCIAPHKGLYAPMGIGVLIARKSLTQTIIEGGTGTNSIEVYQPSALPERLESGTLNVPAISGISAGVEFVKEKGLDKIYAGEQALILRLYEGLSQMNKIKLYAPRPTVGLYAPLLSFNVEDIPSEKVARMLSEKGIAVRGGLHCAPLAHRQMGTLEQGAVRVSVSAFNKREEIDAFLKILRKIN